CLLINISLGGALFLGVPGLVAWLGRVNIGSGFQLRSAAPIAFAGAVLLGLSLWPWVAQLIVAEKAVGFSTMPKALEDKLEDLSAQWRTTSPLLVLLAMAGMPAGC